MSKLVYQLHTWSKHLLGLSHVKNFVNINLSIFKAFVLDLFDIRVAVVGSLIRYPTKQSASRQGSHCHRIEYS